MDDQKIYMLMAKTPDIRALQIADALDQELVDVSNALRSLVEVGDVVKHSGTSPNGRPAQMYNLSEAFKKSSEGVALLASVVAVAPAPVTAPEPAATPEAAMDPAAAFPTPVFAKQAVPKRGRTKAEMVVDHLTVHKSATDAEMRVVMGLPKTSSVRSYVPALVKSGRIIRDDSGIWTLGDIGQTAVRDDPKPAPLPIPQLPELDPPAFLGVNIDAGREPTPQPQALVVAPEAAPVPAAAPHAGEPVFRCGLWSDGVLELQRNGQQVAALNRHEGEQLVEFMGRMLGQAETVAAS